MSDAGRGHRPGTPAPARPATEGARPRVVLRRAVGYSMRERMAPVHYEREMASKQIARSLKAWRAERARQPAHGHVEIPEGGGAPLAGEVRQRMEGQLGADLSGVRVHTGGDSAKAAEGMAARAFTVGQDVHFGGGEFAPGTKEGDRLLAHELTHTVQGARSGIQRKADPNHEGEPELEVSQPGDGAEVEADAVADQATARLHGEAKPGAKDKPASIGAQLEGAGRKVLRAPVAGTIKDPYHVGPGDPKTAQASFNLGKDSNAENPNFEKDAINFEKNLGGVAFGKGQSIGAGIIGKVRTYLQSKVSTADFDAMGSETQKLLAKCGGAEKSFAGSVGTDPKVLQQVLLGKQQLDALKAQIEAAKGDVEKLKALPEPPNVREQMTLVYNFATQILIKDIFNTPKDQLHKLVADGKLNGDAVDKRVAFMEQQAALRKGRPEQRPDRADGAKAWDLVGGVPDGGATPGGDASAAKTPDAVKGQWSARDKRNPIEKSQGMPETPTTSDASRTGAALKAEGAGLSGREAAIQGMSSDSDPVKWSEGAKVWVINEKDKWVQAIRQLSLPLAAGPSGTTNVLMNANAMLGGVSPVEARLACIGYLLPIHAHSLVEICAAAAAHGVPFTAGKQIYHELPPLSADELRNCGRPGAAGKNLFPDEPDATPAAAAAPAAAPAGKHS